MKDLRLYLRARRWHIVLWAINWALFALMARLGGMGAENVAYTALLSAVCALAVGAADCRKFLKKHRLLWFPVPIAPLYRLIPYPFP